MTEARSSHARHAFGLSSAYGIAQLCRSLGVTRRALYFYETAGLITPERDARNARCYGLAEVKRLERVLALRRAGMGIRDILAIQSCDPADTERLIMITAAKLSDRVALLEQQAEATRQALANLRALLGLSDFRIEHAA